MPAGASSYYIPDYAPASAPYKQGHDDMIAWRAALVAAASTGGTVMDSPGPGQFRSGCIAMPDGITLRGQNPQSNIFTVPVDFGADLFPFTSGNPVGSQILDLQINHAVPFSGRTVFFENTYECKLRIWLRGSWGPVAIQLSGAPAGQPGNMESNRIVELNASGTSAAGRILTIGGPAGTSMVTDTYLDRCTLAAGEMGVVVVNAGGVYPTGCNIMAMRSHGWLVYPQAGQQVTWLRPTNCFGDTCGGAGWYIGGGGGLTGGLDLDHCWASMSGLSGFILGEDVVDITLDTPTAFSNAGYGILNYGAGARKLTVINPRYGDGDPWQPNKAGDWDGPLAK